MPSGKPRKDHHFDFVADDRERIFARSQQRELHKQRQVGALARNAPEARPTAWLRRVEQTTAVAALPRPSALMHGSRSFKQSVAQNLGKAGFAYLASGGIDVIGHAHKDQYVAFGVERAIAGGRIVIAR